LHIDTKQVFSQPLFCSNIKETRFFWLHAVITGTVGQRFFLLIKTLGK